MRLAAGERLRLTDDDKWIRVTAGRLEVYAVTREGTSFHQIFLMELSPGEAAFPALDDFGRIDTEIYAVEDTEAESFSFSALPPEEMAPLMRKWFAALAALPWLRLLADRGDEVLRTWPDGTALRSKETDSAALSAAFAADEGIFSMLAGVRFHSLDRRLSARTENRARQKQRLVDETISALLGEE